jgi:hypothetical protein
MLLLLPTASPEDLTLLLLLLLLGQLLQAATAARHA